MSSSGVTITSFVNFSQDDRCKAVTTILRAADASASSSGSGVLLNTDKALEIISYPTFGAPKVIHDGSDGGRDVQHAVMALYWYEKVRFEISNNLLRNFVLDYDRRSSEVRHILAAVLYQVDCDTTEEDDTNVAVRFLQDLISNPRSASENCVVNALYQAEMDHVRHCLVRYLFACLWNYQPVYSVDTIRASFPRMMRVEFDGDT